MAKTIDLDSVAALDRFLKLKEVMELTSYGRSSIFHKAKSGEFPASIKIGPRAARWRLSEIVAWMDKQG